MANPVYASQSMVVFSEIGQTVVVDVFQNGNEHGITIGGFNDTVNANIAPLPGFTVGSASVGNANYGPTTANLPAGYAVTITAERYGSTTIIATGDGGQMFLIFCLVSLSYSGPYPSVPSGIPFINEALSLNQDLSKPDNATVLWPMPRNAKYDIASVIKIALSNFGITSEQIPIITEGSFQPSLLRTTDGQLKNRAVIMVSRSSDTAKRMGIGENFGGLINDGTSMLNAGSLPDDALVLWNGQYSETSIDVIAFAVNEELAEQLYTALKILMIAVRQVFTSQLGYINPPLRVSGSDDPDIRFAPEKGLQGVVFVRRLTYSASFGDFVGSVPQVMTLLQEQLIAGGREGNETLPPVDI